VGVICNICFTSRRSSAPLKLGTTPQLPTHRDADFARVGLRISLSRHGFLQEIEHVAGSPLDVSSLDTVVVTTPPVSIRGMGTRPLREVHLHVSTLAVSCLWLGKQIDQGSMSCGVSPAPRLHMGEAPKHSTQTVEEAEDAMLGLFEDLSHPMHPCWGTGDRVMRKQERRRTGDGYGKSLFGALRPPATSRAKVVWAPQTNIRWPGISYN